MTGYVILGAFLGALGSAAAMGAWWFMHRSEWVTKRRLKQSGARACFNCKHTDKGYEDEPCCYCDSFSEWEAKE